MTHDETLEQLKALGSAKVRAQNAKGGAGDNQYGVSLGDIRVLAKKIRTDHALALSLWDTGNVDAQFLAALLIEPKKLSAKEMDRMVRSISFVRVADWFNSYVVSKHADKEALREDWMAAAEDPMVTFKGRTVAVDARLLVGPERDEKWAVATAKWPNYDKYAERTDRELPIFWLTPR